jgi:hypothetical protein
MTPDQRFTLWTTALTALPTIVFTGVVAFWTWRRDQERVIVQKSPRYWQSADGKETEAALCGLGIIVTNLSLYPVRIAGLGFRLDGKHALALDNTKWTPEVPSHARMAVYADDGEWNLIKQRGLHTKIMDDGFVAVALTETGTHFYSNRLNVGFVTSIRTVKNRFKKIFKRSKTV